MGTVNLKIVISQENVFLNIFAVEVVYGWNMTKLKYKWGQEGLYRQNLDFPLFQNGGHINEKSPKIHELFRDFVNKGKIGWWESNPKSCWEATVVTR